MSFPINDQYWTDTIKFLKQYIGDKDKLVAPIEFREIFKDRTEEYTSVLLQEKKIQWVIIHKGMLGEINYSWLDNIVKNWKAVFANEVFIIFSTLVNIPQVSNSSPHLVSFFENSKKEHNFSSKLLRFLKKALKLFNQKKHRQEKVVFNKSQEGAAKIIDYSALSVTEIKGLMDERYENKEAYNLAYLWDEVRAEELNRQILKIINSTTNQKILEIGCGVGGSASYIYDCLEFIGTDLSDSAISQAKERFGDRQNFKFISMDATDLKFADHQFDIVIAREVIEHLPDPESSMREVFRVLKPNGLLVVTSPNRDSLHLRINRKLGYSDFKCSFDHVKEFSFKEAVEMLTKVGFTVRDTGGVFLQPYWGIPNIDKWVRAFTDNDPEIVEITREMGERVGAEYAFCFVIGCIKPHQSDESI